MRSEYNEKFHKIFANHSKFQAQSRNNIQAL